MNRSKMRLVLGCAALAATLLAAAPGAEAETGDDEWVPALNVAFLLFRYEADGVIDTTLDFSDRGSDDKTVVTFPIGLDLKSPAIEAIPFEPHVALFAGLQAGPSQDIHVTGVGELSPIQPELRLSQNPNEPSPDDYTGQGSELIGTYDSLGWYLGAGLVFDLPTRPQLRIRPFFMYTGEQAKIKGEVVQVLGTPGNYVIERDRAKEDEIFHYIGPGLEFEAMLTTGEHLGVSLYATFDFLFNVGEDSVDFQDSLSRYHYEADSFKARGGLGVRLSWLSGLSGL